MRQQTKKQNKVKQKRQKFIQRSKISNNKTRLIKKQQRKEKKIELVRIEKIVEYDVNDFMGQKINQYCILTFQEAKQRILDQLSRKIDIKRILGKQTNIYNIQKNKNCRIQAKKYLKKLAMSQKSIILSLQFKKNKKSVQLNILYQPERNKSHIILSKYDYLLLNKRKNIIQAIKRLKQQFSNQNYQQNCNFSLQNQICALYKINREIQYDIQSILNQTTDKTQQLSVNTSGKQRSYQINNEYMKFLITKNINKAINQREIDLVNYFVIKENEQKMQMFSKAEKFIEDMEDFHRFIQVHKFKSNKIKRKLLKTACAGCFSNYYESYNPIKRCLKCGIRYHRLCHESDRKCVNCQSDMKKLSCIICMQKHQKGKGLLFHQINIDNKQKFAHTFCILSHNLWTIQNLELKVTLNQQNNIKCCNICKKQSNFCLKGLNNDVFYHGKCAYFKGYELIAQDSTIYIKDDMASEKLQFTRKYTLNYEGLVYQKDVFQSILKYNHDFNTV